MQVIRNIYLYYSTRKKKSDICSVSRYGWLVLCYFVSMKPELSILFLRVVRPYRCWFAGSSWSSLSDQAWLNVLLVSIYFQVCIYRKIILTYSRNLTAEPEVVPRTSWLVHNFYYWVKRHELFDTYFFKLIQLFFLDCSFSVLYVGSAHVRVFNLLVTFWTV